MDSNEIASELKQLIEVYRKECVTAGSEADVLLDRILCNAEAAARIAPFFDFRDIKCNGIRTLIKYSSNYFRVAVSKSSNKTFVTNFIHVIKAVDLWFQATSKDVCLDFQSCSYDQQLSFYSKAFSYNEDATRILFGSKFRCLNMPSMKMSCDIILRLMVTMKTTRIKHVLRPLSARHKTIAKHASSAVPLVKRADYIRFFAYATSPTMRCMASTMRSMIAISKSVSTKGYRISVPRTHLLIVETDKLLVSVQSIRAVEVVVKFRVLKRKEGPLTGKLVLFVHGGAFMFPKAAAIENPYLKDITYNLQGASILSYCIPIAPFPEAMQQLLDTYAWLLSEDPHVEQIFGFKPEEIVFCGDSSGGNQVFSLLVLLNELSIRKPKSMVLFFPKTSLQRDVFPSLLLAQYDAFASISLLSAGCISYVPIMRKDDQGKLSLVQDLDEIPVNFVASDSYVLIESSILSPIRYPKLSDFHDTPLHILALENDPLLDESIQLAKRWHGPVHLQVMDNIAHGGLLFNYCSKQGKKCLKLASHMLRRSLSE